MASCTSQVCYFKCNTVDESYRGYGIGSTLLRLSIDAAKQQGAKAGISHLWKQSPGNSAVKYFTKCGGQLVQSLLINGIKTQLMVTIAFYVVITATVKRQK